MRIWYASVAILAAILNITIGSTRANGQVKLTEAETSAATIDGDYRVTSNIVYLTANNYEDKLDVYQPVGEGVHPTLIYIYGGGWVGWNKENSVLQILPFLEKRWAVVSIDYRKAKVSPAPAAVEDCRCALRWVYEHAKEYNFDPKRIVVMGTSSGGHLALMTGMLTPAAGLDRQCPGKEEPKVAAILDWFGVTDVNDLLDGPNMREFAVTWLGGQPDREEMAKRVSPLTYVRPNLPPIFMVHGDADPAVPYSHSVRLHDALDKAGVPNEFIRIPGGKHGHFSHAETEMAYSHVWAFLAKYLPKSP